MLKSSDEIREAPEVFTRVGVGGEYEYLSAKSYFECAGCIHFYDNEYMERFECWDLDREKKGHCYEAASE